MSWQVFVYLEIAVSEVVEVPQVQNIECAICGNELYKTAVGKYRDDLHASPVQEKAERTERKRRLLNSERERRLVSVGA